MPLIHSIGNYQFHALKGAPLFTQTNHSGETRIGVNGHVLWDVGTWGEPFTLESWRGVLTYADALATWGWYHVATGNDPEVLTIGGVAIPGGKFQVLHVEPIEVRAVVRFKVAGDPLFYRGLVHAKWTLLGLADAGNLLGVVGPMP